MLNKIYIKPHFSKDNKFVHVYNEKICVQNIFISLLKLKFIYKN